MKTSSAPPLTCVYCVVAAGRRPSLRGIPRGLPRAGPPRLVDAGNGLWLAVADAPAHIYGEAPLEARLGDLAWVARCALAHEAVVEFMATRAPCLPLKLFTLFRSDERAIAHVARRRRRIARALSRVAGCAEWGVRVWQGSPPARRRQRPSRQRPRATSGTAFLLGKQAERRTNRQVQERAQANATNAHKTLARYARDARRNRPERSLAAGPAVLLDAAYLVPRTEAVGFRAMVRRLARDLAGEGQGMILTGPWPPYNFVEERV